MCYNKGTREHLAYMTSDNALQMND